ncbi:hypothetical protein ACFWWN_36355, partial [Streptomyces sp. NPDC059082]
LQEALGRDLLLHRGHGPVHPPGPPPRAPPRAPPRLWDVDRLHLTADGHRRVAEAVWQALGLAPEEDWRTPLPPGARAGWADRRIADARFAREHLGPWIGRRLTGRSSGDGRAPKRPELLPYEHPAGP